MEQFLGRATSVSELHLIPYLQYIMVNEQEIDPRKINSEERQILALLRSEGHIEGGMTGLSVTPEFWEFCCEVLWRAYVAYREVGEDDAYVKEDRCYAESQMPLAT